MRNLLLNRLIQTSFTRSAKPNPSLLCLLSFPRNAGSAPLDEDESKSLVFTSGLNCALASKGVIAKGKVFPNLKPSELKEHGATIAKSLSRFPVHVRGSVVGGASKISKAQFGKLVKQVTNHLSSIPNIFVHDGTIGSSPNCDAKFSLCSLRVVEAIGVGSQSNNGFIAADIEMPSLVLCGKAFLDASAIKKALSLLSEPIISARGGIPLPGRILASGDSVIVLFAPEDSIQSCADSLVSADAGIILSSQSVGPLFQTGNSGESNVYKLPAAVVFVSSDSSEDIPYVSKLSPGQAAYHFLAGYQNGNFVPSFNDGLSCFEPLEIAKALLAKLRDNQISAYLININKGRQTLTGEDFVKLVDSTLSKDIPPLRAKGGDLRRKYKAFLSAKYPQLPEDFAF